VKWSVYNRLGVDVSRERGYDVSITVTFPVLNWGVSIRFMGPSAQLLVDRSILCYAPLFSYSLELEKGVGQKVE
jgi:hypothetical protein